MIKTDDWMEAILPLLKEGKSVRIKPTGGSMIPFITGDRDMVEIKEVNSVLKRGDIVLYRRVNGRYILHRIYKVSGDEYYMLGDSQNYVEGPIRKEQIVAQSEIYYKDGVRKDNRKASMRIKYTVWFWLRPFRRALIGINSFKRRLMGKE